MLILLILIFIHANYCLPGIISQRYQGPSSGEEKTPFAVCHTFLHMFLYFARNLTGIVVATSHPYPVTYNQVTYVTVQHSDIWRHSSSPICLALSVNGTYLTPISLVLRMAPPSAGLSTCSRYWSRPSGPTGMMMRPPGASWSTNFGKSI